MRRRQLLLGTLLLASCNSILGNVDYHVDGASAGTTSGSSGSGGSGRSGGTDAGAGGMTEPDLCVGKVCNTPPAAVCDSPAELKTHDNVGSCAAGVCSYAEHLIACTCQADACTTDPCIAVTCASPPDPNCKDPDTLTTHAASGTCSAGSCRYAPKDTTCDFGCANGACKPDPCAGVTCNVQPAAECKDVHTKTTYAATGTCSAGTCTYAPSDKGCGTNQLCGGAGVCAVCKADASCGATCTACAGRTNKCKDLGTTSTCMEMACVSDGDCSWPTPSCNMNVCGQPSCVGLAKTCGPAGTGDCCAASLVTGGTFNRDNDKTHPATVGNFRLDNYEITVGRFRKFVNAYTRTMTASGAGKNPNNGSDTGWDSVWNNSLDADATALKAALNCNATFQTWTDLVGGAAAESLPINCLNWFEAEAFCIWDGGRLPTEAEWNYAAAGGTAQRSYPWGDPAPSADANLAAYGCYYPSSSVSCTGVASIAPVGSISAGNGRYGQSDLAGNVWEWVQDWHSDTYPASCDNCANSTASGARGLRGGSFSGPASDLRSSFRNGSSPSNHGGSYGLGARCARTP